MDDSTVTTLEEGREQAAPRSVTDAPLLAGFGISSPEAAAEAAALADGVVVGSRAVEIAHAEGPAALGRFVGSLRAALDAVPA